MTDKLTKTVTPSGTPAYYQTDVDELIATLEQRVERHTPNWLDARRTDLIALMRELGRTLTNQSISRAKRMDFALRYRCLVSMHHQALKPSPPPKEKE